MKQFKHYTIIGIVFVLIVGTLAHFLYDWTGRNPVIGLFTPVNESIWEHMKLLFFPMVLYGLVMILKFKKDYPCIISSLCFGIVIGTLLIPVFYYAYVSVFGRNIFIMDMGTFILAILMAFWLSYRLTLSCRLKPYTVFWCGLAIFLCLCFLLFTYHPPAGKIFTVPVSSSE